MWRKPFLLRGKPSRDRPLGIGGNNIPAKWCASLKRTVAARAGGRQRDTQQERVGDSATHNKSGWGGGGNGDHVHDVW